MPFTAAKTISPELLDALNMLAEQADVDELQLEQVEFRARKLKNADVSDYYMILGICESIRRNPSKVKEQFELALQHAKSIGDVVANYIISLHEAGDSESAQNLLVEYRGYYNSNPDVLAELFSSALTLGDLDTLAAIEQRFAQMNIDNFGLQWSQYVEDIKSENIAPSAIQSILLSARKFLAERGVRRAISAYSFSGEYRAPLHLTQSFCVAKSAPETHAMELELQDALFSQWAMWDEQSKYSPLDVVTVSLSTEASDGAVHLHS